MVGSVPGGASDFDISQVSLAPLARQAQVPQVPQSGNEGACPSASVRTMSPAPPRKARHVDADAGTLLRQQAV